MELEFLPNRVASTGFHSFRYLRIPRRILPLISLQHSISKKTPFEIFLLGTTAIQGIEHIAVGAGAAV